RRIRKFGSSSVDRRSGMAEVKAGSQYQRKPMRILLIVVMGLVAALAQAQSNQTPAQASSPAPAEPQHLVSQATNALPAPVISLTPAQTQESTNSTVEPELADQSLQAHIARQLPQSVLPAAEAKPNEIVTKHLTFSG